MIASGALISFDVSFTNMDIVRHIYDALFLLLCVNFWMIKQFFLMSHTHPDAWISDYRSRFLKTPRCALLIVIVAICIPCLGMEYDDMKYTSVLVLCHSTMPHVWYDTDATHELRRCVSWRIDLSIAAERKLSIRIICRTHLFHSTSVDRKPPNVARLLRKLPAASSKHRHSNWRSSAD